MAAEMTSHRLSPLSPPAARFRPAAARIRAAARALRCDSRRRRLSMDKIIDRYNSHSKTLQRADEPTQLDLHEDSNCARLREELAEASLWLRQMRGEELQSLNVQQLQALEKSLESGLGSVLKTKSKKIMDEISELERKRVQLIEENSRLKEQLQASKMEMQVAADSSVVYEEGQSPESVTNTSYPRPPLDTEDSSDTSLRLGLPLFNSK